MRYICLCVFLFSVCFCSRGAEEKIRGVLEKTVKAGACAQITDALAEIYYINKTDEAEKAIANFVGKNERVVISGTVETKEGDTAYFFNLKSAEPYTPKLPPAPAPAAAPAAPDAGAPPLGDNKLPAPEKKEEKK